MATNTPNLNLSQPQVTDKITDTIPALSNNFSIIDGAINTNNNQIGILSDSIGVNIESYPVIAPEADDTGRFQRAVNAAYAKGVLKIPLGTYNIVSVNVTSPLIIVGMGQTTGTTINVNNTTNNIGFKVTSNNVDFYHLCVKSIGTKSDGNNVTGIQFDNGSGSIGYNIIDDCAFQNFSGAGIKYVNTIHVKLKDLYATGCHKAIWCSYAYSSFGTTVTGDSLYLNGNDFGLYLEQTNQSVFTRVILEYCGVGVYQNACGYNDFYGAYFENITTYDFQAIDTPFANIGQVKASKGNSITWQYQSASSRILTEASFGAFSGKSYTHYYEKALSEKTILPYRFANQNTASYVDGLIYDNQRVIPTLTGKNLLKPNGWNYAFDPNLKCIHWLTSSSGTQYCSQSVTLAPGNYVFVASLLMLQQGQLDQIDVVNSGSTVITSFIPDNGNYISGSNARRYVYFPFTISASDTYTIRFSRWVNGGSTQEIQIYGGVLYDANNSIDTTTQWGTGSFDQAMQQAMMLSGILASIRDGYDGWGKGNKVTYGTAAPTTGTWNVGDECRNTTPTAGGYMGWVCTTAGTPGTWKGYGAIQA